MTNYDEAVRRAMKSATEHAKKAQIHRAKHMQIGPNDPDSARELAYVEDVLCGFVEIIKPVSRS